GREFYFVFVNTINTPKMRNPVAEKKVSLLFAAGDINPLINKIIETSTKNNPITKLRSFNRLYIIVS
ncbi:MAG TPA: hypothetical protein VK616_02935, partial [Flavitalea sp.]|nr:hypothetical protein [Flavitalea sp.]